MTRFILPLVALVMLWTAPAWALTVFGTSTTGASVGGASATSLALPAMAVTAGQFVPVCFKWEGNTTLTGISDTAGNTYTLLTGQQHSSLEPSVRMGYVLSATAHAANIITGTFSGSSPYRRGGAMTFTYNGSMSTDGEAGSTEDNSDVTPSSNTLTTAGTDGVLLGCHGDYTVQAFSNETLGNPAVARDFRLTQTDFDMWYKIPTATQTNGTSSLTRGNTERWVQRFAAFKTTGGSAGPPAPPVTTTTRYVDQTAATCSTYTPATRLCGSGTSNNYASIPLGFRALTAGDTLYIRAGTYTIATSGTGYTLVNGAYGNQAIDTYGCNPTCPTSWATATTISNYPGEQVTLKGIGFNMDNAFYSNGLSYLIWQGDTRANFVIDGTSAANTTGLRTNNAVHHIRFSTLTVKNFADFGIAGGTSNGCTKHSNTVQILNSEIRHNGANGSVGNPSLAQTHGLYPSCGDNWLLDSNYIVDNWGYGIHANSVGLAQPALINMTITNNTVEGRSGPCCASGQLASGIVFTTGANPLIANNTIIAQGSAATVLQNGIQLSTGNAGAVTGAKVYNNTIVGAFTSSSVYLSGATGSLIKNNLINGSTNPYAVDSGWSVASASNNLCNQIDTDVSGGCDIVNASPLFVNAASLDFHLQAASPAVNTGVAITGFPFNTYTGKTLPDIGAYETSSFSNATITGNTMLVTIGQNIAANNPMLPATGVQGFAVNNGRTVTAAIRQASSDSVFQLTISGGACADSDSWTVTYTPGNVVDTRGQPMMAFSGKAVTNVNCSGGTPPTAVVTQANHQWLDAFYQTGTTTVVPLSAVGATTTTIHSGIPAVLAVQTDGTISDPLAFGQRVYYRLTPLSTGTPGSFTQLTDTLGADQVAFGGLTIDPTVLNGPTPATCLSGALTPQAGVTLQTSVSVPIIDLPLNGCTVNRFFIQFGPFAVLGDFYEFIVKNQTGALFDSYVPAGGAKITITPVAGNSAPTGLYQVGMPSSSVVDLIWTPIEMPNFAMYRVYQSSTSGVAGTLVYQSTPVKPAATYMPITQWRTVIGQAGVYYFTVSWVDTGGQESPVSAEVAVTVTGFTTRGVRTP